MKITNIILHAITAILLAAAAVAIILASIFLGR